MSLTECYGESNCEGYLRICVFRCCINQHVFQCWCSLLNCGKFKCLNWIQLTLKKFRSLFIPLCRTTSTVNMLQTRTSLYPSLRFLVNLCSLHFLDATTRLRSASLIPVLELMTVKSPMVWSTVPRCQWSVLWKLYIIIVPITVIGTIIPIIVIPPPL